ncbi:MAG: flagellar biosynthesis protein FlhF [Methyloprofundus sp.]|nr:MAG: flagellar biosynthesis protein FlhF [Methyloprofundus sp.]
MKIKRFFATDIRQVMRMVKDELGADAVIMSNRSVDGGVEIVAARDFDEQLVHENLKKQQQHQATQKRSEMTDFAAEKDSIHIVSSARKSAEEPESLLRPGVRRKLDEYVGYAEKTALNSKKITAKVKPFTQPKNTKSLKPSHIDESKLQARSQVSGLQKSMQHTKESVVNGSNDLLQEMYKELRSLRATIDNKISADAWGVQQNTSPIRLDLLRRLSGIGLSKKLSIKIANRLDNQADIDQGWEKALEMMEKVLPIASDDLMQEGGVVALVGPTGVGKTTTIAKLAAQFILQHGSSRQVALITMDNYRIGAHEQLSTYGRILDVPVRVAADGEELRSLINSFSDKRLILIDTAGVSQKDQRMLEQIEELQEADIQVKPYLVMSATTQLKAMDEIIQGFAGFELEACILTKMDETAETGHAISALIEHQLPLAFITDGQQVPEDIHKASSVMLINQCIAESESEANYNGTPEFEEWVAAGYA